MFRTLTLAAATALIAGSAFAADDFFVDLAKQDDDRAAVRALTKAETGSFSVSSKGGSTANDIFIQLAEQDDDRAAVRALSHTGTDGVAFSSKSARISGLEIAYQNALENDDHQLAKQLAKRLGR